MPIRRPFQPCSPSCCAYLLRCQECRNPPTSLSLFALNCWRQCWRGRGMVWRKQRGKPDTDRCASSYRTRILCTSARNVMYVSRAVLTSRRWMKVVRRRRQVIRRDKKLRVEVVLLNISAIMCVWKIRVRMGRRGWRDGIVQRGTTLARVPTPHDITHERTSLCDGEDMNKKLV